MKEFYLIKKLNKIIPITNVDEIVTRMREFEWGSKSNNNDYMHVYAFWKSQNSNMQIRYNNEREFIEDLFRFHQIERVGYWDYLKKNLFSAHKHKRHEGITFS